MNLSVATGQCAATDLTADTRMIEPMDVTSFREKSRSVWDAMATGWDEQRRVIAEGGRPVVDALVTRLAPTAEQTILELAGGTGEVGFTVATAPGENGRVIVTDFSTEMVRVARRVGGELGLRNVEYLVLDAEDMTLANASVDGVICRWGYMLMPRPARALAETRRVLRQGGCLAFAVFAEPARNPWAALASGVLVAGGYMTPPAASTPGIFALHDAAALARVVRESGFREVEIVEVPHLWHFPDAPAYWNFLTQVAGAISMVLRSSMHRHARLFAARSTRSSRATEQMGVCAPGGQSLRARLLS